MSIITENKQQNNASAKTPTNTAPAATRTFSREYELNSLLSRKLQLEYEEYEYNKRLQEVNMSDEERNNTVKLLHKTEEEKANIDERIEEIETILEQEKIANSRGKHYNKYLVFRNIRELLKKSDIKLGQIEKEAGCQAGYMSRLEKTDNATEPTTEFLVTASQILGISLDTLLKTSIADFSPTELYMIRFLEKLIRDTESDKLNWVNEPQYIFTEIESSDSGKLTHPLFTKSKDLEGLNGLGVSATGVPYRKTRSYFPSKSFGGLTTISHDCYHLKMKDQAVLYIMSVAVAESPDNAQGKDAVELWMLDKYGKSSCLCTDHEGKEKIIQLVFRLWLSVNQYDTRPKISKEHRDIIDSFLMDEDNYNIADNQAD